MNEQHAPTGIEWTRMYGRRGFTWNPTAGCFHGCTWQMPDGSVTECYAKTIAEKFNKVYYDGFETHYHHPERLVEPFRLKEPAGIFVGSMADLFGHWVPDYQIQEIIGVMKGAHWHIYQTLSKFPIRLQEFNPFPANVWTGVSLPAGHSMPAWGAARALKTYLKHIAQVQSSVRFMSIEPLWFDVAPIFEVWIEHNGKLPFEWAIIGAASNGNKLYPPDEGHTRALVDILNRQGIPIFFKGNMKSLPWALANWHEQFPGEMFIPQQQPETKHIPKVQYQQLQLL